MDVIYLEFCKALDKVPHNILAPKLEIWWVDRLLDGEGIGCMVTSKELQ